MGCIGDSETWHSLKLGNKGENIVKAFRGGFGNRIQVEICLSGSEKPYLSHKV